MRLRSVAALVALGATASVILARLARAVESRELEDFDQRVRAQLLPFRSRQLDAVSAVITAMSAPAFLVPVTMAIAFSQRKRGTSSWLPLALAPVAAMTAGQLMTLRGPKQFPPASSDEDCSPCFPSGHTTGLTAEAMTVAYVLRREAVLSRNQTLALMAFPMVAGMNRLYRDRHWVSDIAGGLAAGTAVGAACALVSEILP